MKNRFIIEFETEEDIIELKEEILQQESADFIYNLNISCDNIKAYYQDEYCIEEEKKRLIAGKKYLNMIADCKKYCDLNRSQK